MRSPAVFPEEAGSLLSLPILCGMGRPGLRILREKEASALRLWHEALLHRLPRAQLLGQHRECCALRGLAWGKRHAVVDYVFRHPREWLAVYHERVMAEMERRGYRVEPLWKDPAYCGRRRPAVLPDEEALSQARARIPVYPEHDAAYRLACLENLQRKGIRLPEA